MIINSSNLTGLTVAYRSAYNDAYAQFKSESQWQQIATLMPSNTKSQAYPFLGMNTMFREWIGERVYQNLKVHGYTIVNKKWEDTIEVDADSIKDDQYGVFTPMMGQLGQDAARHPDKLVFDLLKAGYTTACYDDQFFFDTDHPVGDGVVSNSGGGAGVAWYLLDTSRVIKPLIFQEREKYSFDALDNPTDENVFKRDTFVYGAKGRANVGFGLWQMAYASKQTLDETNLSAAIAAMKSFKSDAGEPLDVKPNLLVVPPGLETLADKLVTALFGANGASNVLAGKLKVVCSSRLA